MSDLSGAFSCSTARSWSYLPIFDEAIVDPDPYRSRNTVAHAQKTYQRGFFKSLIYKRELGEGAVFTVDLYENRGTQKLFAVKIPKAVKRVGEEFYHVQNQRPKSNRQAGIELGNAQQRQQESSPHQPDDDRKKPIAGEGVSLAFKEIQIISHTLLHNHVNIIDIVGWDWTNDGVPAIIVEYAEYGTLKEFIQARSDELSSDQRRMLCLNVACGLSALHAADVAHGDVKTTNVLMFRSTKNEWLAKVSDFSHSMFGLSLQRKTTYPGSGMYNAPEIRKRHTMISSEKIPCCEAFSFGLLVWEVLLDGASFLDGSSIVSSIATSVEDLSRDGGIVDVLMELPKDELLKWAKRSLYNSEMIRAFDKPLFAHIFDMTLHDNPSGRERLAMLANRLDEFDSGSICHFSVRTALAPYAVWNFEPWADINYQEKAIAVREKARIVDGPRESHHAEMFFILSRCFAEGYGCTVDLKQAFRCLYESAFNDCADATYILELSPHLLTLLNDGKRHQALGSNSVSDAFREVKRKQARMRAFTGPKQSSEANPALDDDTDAMSSIFRLWLAETRERVRSNKFQYQIGRHSGSSSWSQAEIVALLKIVKRSGLDICELFIDFQNLTNPVNTATYLEVAARHGIRQALSMGLTLLQDCDIENSSWGSTDTLWETLLIEAAKGGCRISLESIIDDVYNSVKADPPSIELTNVIGESPLHFLSFVDGAEKEIEIIVGKLLRLGFRLDSSIRTKTWFGPFGLEVRGTPLQMAIKCGCLRTTRVLLSCGARVMEKGVLSLSPLELACSLHYFDIVHALLASLPDQKRHYERALHAIGHPTPRGWFDRLPILNSISRNFQIKQTLRAFERCFAEHELLTPADRLEQLLNEADGTALSSAILAGQRDQDLVIAMLNCGLGPRTHEGRFGLLSAIMSLERADTNRIALLKAVLGHTNLVFVKSEQRFMDWIKGWPSFFKEYRYTWNPQNQKTTMLHLWVIMSDEEGLRTAQDLWPESVALMSAAYDENGCTPREKAIDLGSLAMYKLLRKYSKEDVQIDISRAKKSSNILRTNPLLAFLQAEGLRRIESHRIIELRTCLKEVLATGTADNDTSSLLESYGTWLYVTYPKRWSQIESILLTSFIWRILDLQGQSLVRRPERTKYYSLLDMMGKQKLAQVIADSHLRPGALQVRVHGILRRHYMEASAALRIKIPSAGLNRLITDAVEERAKVLGQYGYHLDPHSREDTFDADTIDSTEKSRTTFVKKLLEREIDTVKRVLKRIFQFEATHHQWMRNGTRLDPGVAGVLNWIVDNSSGSNATELELALVED